MILHQLSHPSAPVKVCLKLAAKRSLEETRARVRGVPYNNLPLSRFLSGSQSSTGGRTPVLDSESVFILLQKITLTISLCSHILSIDRAHHA